LELKKHQNKGLESLQALDSAVFSSKKIYKKEVKNNETLWRKF